MPRAIADEGGCGAACCGKALSTASTRGAATRKEKALARRIRDECIAYSLRSRRQKFLPHERPTVEQIVRDLRPKSLPRAFSRLDIDPASARADPLRAAVARADGALVGSSAASLCLTRRQEPAHGGSLSKGLPP